MSARLAVRLGAAFLSLGLLAGLGAPPPRAAAADEEIRCSSCGKSVKKSKATKVIKDGQVYWVCSSACAQKIKKK